MWVNRFEEPFADIITPVYQPAQLSAEIGTEVGGKEEFAFKLK